MRMRQREPSSVHIDGLPCGSCCPVDTARGGVPRSQANAGGTGGGHSWSTFTSRSC